MEELEQGLEQESSATEEPGDGQATSQEAAPDVLDLDKVERFRFAGREWTPKDFQGAYMMHADYSRKTQALAKEREYYENLQADLDAVKADPRLVEQFKKIYPESFHKFLGYVSTAKPAQGQNGEAQSTQYPRLLSRIEKIEKEFEQRQTEAINAELDAKFQVLSKKFPMADEDLVIARAEVLANQGKKLDDKTWESLWKQANDAALDKAKKHYSELVKQQKQSNQKAKDVGSGGGVMAPAGERKHRTVREASEAFLREQLANG